MVTDSPKTWEPEEHGIYSFIQQVLIEGHLHSCSGGIYSLGEEMGDRMQPDK